MSVLIKGMDMPKNCVTCHLNKGGLFCPAMPDNFCGYCSDSEEDPIPNWCPLVEVPDNHGRLIDASRVIDVIDILEEKGESEALWKQMKYIVDDTPTVIPSDKEDGT